MREITIGAEHGKAVVHISGDRAEAVHRDGVVCFGLLVGVRIRVKLVQFHIVAICFIFVPGLCADILGGHGDALIGDAERIQAGFKRCESISDAGGAAVGSGVGSAVAAGAAAAVGASAALGAAEDAAEPQADRETAQASARAMRGLFIIFHILNKK